MSFKFSAKEVDMILKHPHLLGHLIGKTKLTQQHSDWIHYLWCNEEHCSIQAHRGSYKTTSVAEVGSIWWHLFHPSDRIALVRKPYTEASKTLGAIARYYQLEVIQALFTFVQGFCPRMLERKENRLVFNFKREITKEGSLDAWGTDQQMTGNHYDKILTDDIVVLKDRLSKAEREKTKSAVREIITNIIDPGKVVMNIGTPWHKFDAWTILPKPLLYPISETGLLSKKEIENKQAHTTPSLFAANYLLKHEADSEALFSDLANEAPWKFGNSAIVYGHVDAAYGGGHYTALTFMSRLPNGQIQVTGWAFQDSVKDKIVWIQEKCKRYNCRRLFNETNPDKGYTADLLEKNEDGKKSSLRVTRYSESMNKNIKIVSYLKEYWDALVWDENIDSEYLEQVVDYRTGQEPDDAPDSASSLLREAFYPTDNAKGGRSLWDM